MESTYNLAIKIVADAKDFKAEITNASRSANEAVDSTTNAAKETASEVESLKGTFTGMGSEAGEVMGALGGAVGGVKGEVVGLIGELTTAAGPIGLLIAGISGIAMAWKEAREDIDKYLERVDKLKYGAPIFTEDSKKAIREAKKSAEGGIDEGTKLKVQAETKLGSLTIKYTEEQKKQLLAQKAMGEQMIKDSQLKERELGYAAGMLSDRVAQLNWIQKYNNYLLKNDELDEKKIITSKEINDLESKLLELKTKIYQPGSETDRQKLEKEYELTALDIKKKKLDLLSEEKTITDGLLSMTGKDHELKIYDLNITNQNAEVERAYNQDLFQTIRLINRANMEQGKMVKSAEELLRIQKEIDTHTQAGFKIETLQGAGIDSKGAGISSALSHTLSDPLFSAMKNINTLKLADESRVVNLNKQIAANQKLNLEMEKENAIADEMTNVFTDMFSNIDGGMKAMVDSLIRSIEKLVEELLVKEAVLAIMNILFPGSGTAASTAIKAGTILTSLPGLASGGIAYGPILAQIGEYPGARTDPEVISPLSTLKEMIGGIQITPQAVRLRVDVGGQMWAYFDYQQKKLNGYR